MNKWIKRQIAAFSLAMSSVEKNTLSQQGLTVDAGVNSEQSHKKGTLEYNLINGEVTQEVKDLRWRMYKILGAVDKVKVNVISTDEEGYHTIETINPTEGSDRLLLAKVKLDSYDKYPLGMVVNNEEIVLGINETLNDSVSGYTDTQVIENKISDSSGNTRTSIGEISNSDYQSTIKSERLIDIAREFRPKFEIEKYTSKLNIRDITDSEKLLEFYVSRYPDEYNRKSRLFISELKRAIINPRSSDMLDIKTVGFLSYKTVGSKDFYYYEYDVQSFDKIIEFDGSYVIKFKCNVTVNGEYLLEKFREEGLETRYKNKERK
tara:strand:+ start:867 stop:1826 length:960 start_codon:yes stop_codon:yes gene_type:complete